MSGGGLGRGSSDAELYLFDDCWESRVHRRLPCKGILGRGYQDDLRAVAGLRRPVLGLVVDAPAQVYFRTIANRLYDKANISKHRLRNAHEDRQCLHR